MRFAYDIIQEAMARLGVSKYRIAKAAGDDPTFVGRVIEGRRPMPGRLSLRPDGDREPRPVLSPDWRGYTDFMIPMTGETWSSSLIGCTIQIKDTNLKDGSVLVSDGRRTMRMFLSAFRDPRNQWKRVKTAIHT